MDTYDIRKQGNRWRLARKGEEDAVASFDTKREAVAFGRDYLKVRGGHLRIWKGSGATSVVQEEHTYTPEAETRVEKATGIFEGIVEGAKDANTAVRQTLPQIGGYLAKSVYGAGYYTAYGVVYGAVAIRSLIPLPDSLTKGVHDGADAALHDYDEAHHEVPAPTA